LAGRGLVGLGVGGGLVGQGPGGGWLGLGPGCGFIGHSRPPSHPVRRPRSATAPARPGHGTGGP
ncbi:30S ribosomal protein S3, partial [Streptomyces sporangiiformans]